MFSILLALLAVTLAEVSVADQALFQNWVSTNNKVYASAEERQYRLKVFASNAEFVRNWDAKARGFEVELNLFADLTNEEFRAMYNGMNLTVEYEPVEPSPLRADIPVSVDWRTKGIVTGVKNQGQCGSCWSFSTTGSVEGCHFLSTGTLVSLSEQNLMDCSWSQGNEGCNGGLMTAAMSYIISNGGVDTESSYPYTAASSHTCKYSVSTRGSTEQSYQNVKQGDENALANAVNKGPVSVAIDASQASFQLYKSGVYYEPRCSSTSLDHGVLAVGYGTDGTTDYWIVKNSWGTSWGMNGYINMSRNRNNNCGIATMATLPTC